MSRFDPVDRRRDTERVVDVFRRFGPDGRAISASSLVRLVCFESDEKSRLAAALAQLLEAGVIQKAGADPLIRERAYRLARPLTAAVPEWRLAA
jgi:hypothetical protein